MYLARQVCFINYVYMCKQLILCDIVRSHGNLHINNFLQVSHKRVEEERKDCGIVDDPWSDK